MFEQKKFIPGRISILWAQFTNKEKDDNSPLKKDF